MSREDQLYLYIRKCSPFEFTRQKFNIDIVGAKIAIHLKSIKETFESL